MKRKVKKWLQKHRWFFPVVILFLFFFYFVIMLKIDGFHILGKKVQDFSYQIQSFFVPKVKVSYQKIDDSLSAEIKKENKQFQQLLKLKDSFSSYEFTFANVISRNKEQWFDRLIINKGEKDGISLHDAIVGEEGLLGMIVEVRDHTADVLLLTTKEKLMKVSVIVEKEEMSYVAFLDGYRDEENRLSAVLMRNTSELEIGDIVKTSGLGESLPSGLPVGIIEKIEYDSLGVKQTLVLRPYTSFDQISFVGIVHKGGRE